VRVTLLHPVGEEPSETPIEPALEALHPVGKEDEQVYHGSSRLSEERIASTDRCLDLEDHATLLLGSCRQMITFNAPKGWTAPFMYVHSTGAFAARERSTKASIKGSSCAARPSIRSL